MKRVVSISLGASKRDHQAVETFGGQEFLIERRGTDGDKQTAMRWLRELDGQVDAFGMGGTDLYVYAGGRRYTFRESAAIAQAARLTPIVDGSGVKNTLERRVIRQLSAQGELMPGTKVLLVCAVDRFGMAEELVAAGCQVVFGDLLFGLGLPLPLTTLPQVAALARVAAPLITKLPVKWFYPTGAKQLEHTPRFARYFEEADVIAGDFHFIRRFMPAKLDGQMVLTNTVTQADEQLLAQRGIGTLITTTPTMGGRSLGTNILEAVLVTLAGKRPEALDAAAYSAILEKIGIQPRVRRLR